MLSVFTVGHSNHEFRTFLDLLRRHGVQVVADVRSIPYSRRFPQFAKRVLAAALDDADIRYLWLGEALGGRQQADAGDAATRYDQIAATAGFQAGLDRVVAEASGRALALMCAEREPMHCHRALLVSRHLAARGVQIEHILADGRIERHGDFETRLIARAGTAPPPLFDDTDGRASALRDAYSIAARGFRPPRPTPDRSIYFTPSSAMTRLRFARAAASRRSRQ